jgi:hypothetical protein
MEKHYNNLNQKLNKLTNFKHNKKRKRKKMPLHRNNNSTPGP